MSIKHRFSQTSIVSVKNTPTSIKPRSRQLTPNRNILNNSSETTTELTLGDQNTIGGLSASWELAIWDSNTSLTPAHVNPQTSTDSYTSIFKVAKAKEKHQILSLLLSYLEFDGETINFTLLEPFDKLFRRQKDSVWQGHSESNQDLRFWRPLY